MAIFFLLFSFIG